jgi:hypothetical protein
MLQLRLHLHLLSLNGLKGLPSRLQLELKRKQEEGGSKRSGERKPRHSRRQLPLNVKRLSQQHLLPLMLQRVIKKCHNKLRRQHL